MDALQRQVAIAYRRLTLERFLAFLGWSWTGTLLLAAAAIAIAKFAPLPVDATIWNAGWLGGALAAGLLIAALWTYFTRNSRIAAAIEIDHRFGLKERVSSALSLDPLERETPAGKALLGDAVRRVERIDVSSKFTVRPTGRILLPAVPAACALALLLISDPTRDAQADANADQAAIAKQIKDSTEPLRKKMEERKKEAAEKGLKDAADLFKKIEEGTRDLTKRDDLDRKQAMVKLNDLAKQLEARREKLGGDEKLKQQLRNLKTSQSGPADQAAQAMKDGDFKKAADEIEKLKQQLDKGNLDDKQKQALEKQLAEMQKAMQKVADAHQQAKNDLQKKAADAKRQMPDPNQLKKQIDDLLKQGRKEEAEKLKQQAEQMAQNLAKLQEQLEKMGAQQPQMDQLQKMANQLGQCAKCLGNGDKAGAQQAMQQMQQGLEALKQQGDELAMLDQALDQIGECKGECNGDGEGKGKNGKGGKGKGKGKGGDGLGEAIGGSGARPIEKTDVGFRDSQVNQNVGKGASVLTGEADGPNIKGQVQAEIQQQIEAARRENTDAIVGQRLPRNQRDHAKQYFDSLREGK